jgi:hypothetical protein
MYRYIVDKAITYTSEDIVLFKESPFACWMERLTLENPEHGIPPDAGSIEPSDSMEPQDDLADTLRGEGKDVVLVAWEATEPERRTATLEAMRHGVDFIVNGQLALGPLSGSANLLMRTSGYSELGNYLYVPCNTQPKTNMHAALRLCFLADLLHSLQGQLPPQMLIIRGGTNVVPLQTEDHIYHYRAVKQRFMSVQHAFRKHKMPDPSESSHFGRWEDCANEVLKQRALRGENAAPEVEEPEETQVYQELLVGSVATAYDLDEVSLQPAVATPEPTSGGTLAEQARSLGPVAREIPSRGAPADTLQNLAFIGSGIEAPRIGEPTRPSAPPPTAQESPRFIERRMRAPEPSEEPIEQPEYKESSAAPMEKAHPLDSPGFQRGGRSMVDLDATAAAKGQIPAPTLSTGSSDEAPWVGEEGVAPADETAAERVERSENYLGRLHVDPFNSSLITGNKASEEAHEDIAPAGGLKPER